MGEEDNIEALENDEERSRPDVEIDIGFEDEDEESTVAVDGGFAAAAVAAATNFASCRARYRRSTSLSVDASR